MKMITAIVRTTSLESVVKSLGDIGIKSMTMHAAKEFINEMCNYLRIKVKDWGSHHEKRHLESM